MARGGGDAKLFVSAIPSVSAIEEGGKVPVPNGSDATFAIDSMGREWVCKRAMGYQQILAEAVSWLLCQELGAPVPQAAVHGIGTEASWLSARLPAVGHWERTRVHFVTNLHALGKVLAVDAITHNPDRHAGNILLQPDPDELNLLAWAIDGDAAMVGWVSDFEALELATPGVENLARGLPIELMKSGALAAAEDAARMPDRLLRGIAVEACRIADAPKELETMSRALTSRMRRAVSLTSDYLVKIEERRQ